MYDDTQRRLSRIRRSSQSFTMIDNIKVIESGYQDKLYEIEALQRSLNDLRSYVNSASRFREEIKQAAIDKGWDDDSDLTALEYLKEN